MEPSTGLRVDSEIGRLETVIVHTPGPEVENMTPLDAERALYSDILNLAVAAREYAEFRGALARVARVLEIGDLLAATLAQETVRRSLLGRICRNEGGLELAGELLELAPGDLARALIGGVPLRKETLTAFLSQERHALRPLHNLFFMRDTAAVIGDRALIGRMANAVRERESLIVETVLTSHPLFGATAIDPYPEPGATIEGGDVLVARRDLLIVGIGARTTPPAVDFLVRQLCADKGSLDIVVQELPHAPESFIHLDMVFTLLDRDLCLTYPPVVLRPSRLATVHIAVRGGRVATIRQEDALLPLLRRLGLDLEPVPCGGADDPLAQEREQWHSGANMLAFAPGKVLGYARNARTLDELARRGFAVLSAAEVAGGRADPAAHGRCVVAVAADELARGGGGCRCMSLPARRLPLD